MIEYTQRQKNQFFKKSAAILVAGALLCSMILPPYAFTYQRGYLSFVEKKSAENHNMRERSNLIGNSREASRVLLKDSIPHGGAEVISDAMEELFVAPYREFLDTFNPVQFFKSHREQTLGQAIGIVMIWGAMVATMIGAPFGIDFLLSGSPTNHLGFTLISSFIGSLSIVAGIRLNHLKENEDQLNQLKKTSGSHSELKQQRSALNVVVQELIHFDQLIQTGYKPNRTEKLILSIAYFTYPVNVLTHHLFNLISNLTRPLGKWRLAPLTKVRVGEDPYQWATREQGIQNVIDGIRRNRPDIIKRYENLKHLKDEEKTYEQQLLEIEFYRISKGHFSIWGLESATRFRRAPYFNGSYIDALILAFPSLNLIPQGFKLYWSTPEEGIESIKYIFSKEIPDIMQKYEGFEKLSEKEVEWVKEKVYKITSGHFYAWGLSSAIHIEKTPYFNGNYIDVLIAVFPKLNLDPLGFKLDWTTKQMGIDSVKYVLSRKIPEIMRQYDRINELTPREIQSLRNSIYRITQGMFKSWGLSAATNSASTPYFNGSYMNPLIFVFDDPRLALSIKGFKDYRKSTRQEIYSWRTYESGIWSVTEAIRSHMPYLLESYENRRNLSKDAIEQLKEEIYKLTSNDFQAWGLNAALSIHRAPYFHGSHINALSIIFTDLNLNPLGFHLDWSNQEKGIESIHFVLSKVRPHLLEAYKNRNSIHSKKVELAKKEIYKISHGHFMMWRLGGATNRKIAPYFKGSFIEALMALFPEFHLNPLEFRLDWSTPKKGIESVRFTLYKESPYIMKQYEMIEELPDKEIQKLRDKIYEIDSGFFKVWGLSAVTSVGQTPYFHGSYIAALLAVFSHPKLGLTREGFAERTGNAGSAATQMAETTGDEDSDSSVMTESPGNEESGSNLTREDSATGDLDSTLMREQMDNRYPGSPLMTEDTRTIALNRGMNPNGWIAQLFFAPHYEFLDTFNPVQFFKSHREQTLGQAIGILLIWGAMVAAMIGAPFGIDFLLSGSPTNHLGFTLLSSFIGSLSIVAGIRLNHLKENEDQLNQLKKTSGSHSELKQQRSALNVVVQEFIHFNKFIQTSYKPNRTEKLILSIAYLSYPVNVLSHHLFNLISNLTRPLGKWRLDPLTKARVGEDTYNWVTREQGIESVRDAIRKNRPDILKRYESFNQLTPRERVKVEKSLRNKIYRITQGHFTIWGLSSAMHRQSAPYFHGTYMNALMAVFPDLNLNPLGFQLDWSSEERGIESVKYILSKEVPYIMQQYERLDQLNDRDIHDLKNKIYEIKKGHFDVWGLSSAMTQRAAPYFYGSHVIALIAVFPKLNLNPLGFQLDWSSEERGIESVKYVLAKEVPHIMREYEKLDQLNDRAIHDLRNEIYEIRQGHFKVWVLSSAMDQKKNPYFHGSYKDVLISVLNHPRLGLTLQGFKDFRRATFELKYSWGTLESGIWSVREGIRSNRPDIIAHYENLAQLKENEIERLKRDIYGIKQAHFNVWGLGAAMNHRQVPYFHGSYIDALMTVFPDLNLNPLGFQLDWSNEGRGIESVKYVLSKEIPHIMQRYERLDQLDDIEIHDLKNEVYGITSGHFNVWGLGVAMDQRKVPYFHGSHINALIALFPDLNLNPLGFQLDWSSEERGIESVKYVLFQEIPHIMQQYERITKLTVREIHDLRNEIYRITSGHLAIWGLGAAITKKSALYFHGSHINVLLALFSNPRLALTHEGFVERNENSDSIIIAETAGDEDPDSTLTREQIDNSDPGSPLMTEDTRTKALNREMNPNGWISQLFFAPHYEFLDTFNPVQFFKSHREQTVGQAIGIVLIWGAMVAAMIGAPFGIDFLLSGSPTNHLGFTLLSSFIGSLSIVAGIRLNQLKENERKLNHLKQTTIQLSELKQQRSALNVVVQEFIHFNKFIQTSYKPNRTEKLILSIAYLSYPVNVLTHHLFNLISNFTRPLGKWRLAPLTKIGVDQYEWATREQGVENVRDGIKKNRHDILERYENLNQLTPQERKQEYEALRNEIYRITQGHFNVWGLSVAMNKKLAPYFHGSYMNALMAVFPDLNLNPLGFQLDWSSEERGIKSVRYVLSKEVPHIIERYERFDQLNDRDIDDLRNSIYEISSKNFTVWGLSVPMNQKSAPYFHGSYMNALMAVFPDLNLNPLGFELDWLSEERGIESVKYVLSKQVPHIMQQYERIAELSDREIHDLRNQIYKINQAHFKVWGLDGSTDQRTSPYFYGSYMVALMTVFSDLNLNPLGFQLDWSSKERGIESVRYVLSKEAPHIMQQYGRIAELSDREIHDLRNQIYGIKQAHFKVWGLSAAMTHESAPYFHGSYKDILISIFSHPRLGLTLQGINDFRAATFERKYSWGTPGSGIWSVREGIRSNRPDIIVRYENLGELKEDEIERLKRDVYHITAGYFMIWGLGGAMNQKSAPYFHGSYMNALMALFPELNLNPLGFQLDWSNEERGLESVKYVLFKEVPHIMQQYERLDQLNETSVNYLRNRIYRITQGHIRVWGLGGAITQRLAPYFHGSYINVLMALFPKLNLNPLGFQLDWLSEERGIESVRYVLSKEVPHIMQQYERIAELNDREIHELRKQIYGITQAHFTVWGLSVPMNQKSAPYFHGSYMNALMAVFPDLNLNPLGFELDWSSEERGIESVKYVLSKEAPHIMRDYERLDQLDDKEMNNLRKRIYELTVGHFQVWGLGATITQKSVSYFHGSYINALMAVFPHSKLGLTREGFVESTRNGSSDTNQVTETSESSAYRVMVEIPRSEDSGSNLTRDDSGIGDSASPLVTEDTRSEAINRGMNPNGWIAQLFFAPHYEFLDTFNPVQFFKSHREQTLGQAIGILLIWGAMVATMIGAPFGIDFLLSGSPTNHLGFTLLSSFIGSLSIVAGIRLNQLKENERKLNHLKQTTIQLSELKQQRSALNVVVQELIHFNKFIQTSYKPNHTEKLILSIAYLSYPVNVLTHHLFNFISNLTRPLGKWRLAPLTKSRVGEYPYQWITREQGIENVRDTIRKNHPDLLERSENLDHLISKEREQEEESLRNEVYRITSGHFNVWGLGVAMNQRKVPYFHGSHIVALMAVFPDLNLNPLGFQLDWSSEESGIESVKYVLSKEVPHIMREYEKLDQLNDRAIHDLRNEIYGIRQGHFKVWGLSSAMDQIKVWGLSRAMSQKSVPYFHGSYIHVLMAVFPNLNLNPLGFQLDWSSEERGIESVKYVLAKEVPHIMREYEKLDQLNDKAIHDLRNEIYGIKQANFNVWGLSRAMSQKSVPYFHGSYINVLISVFNHSKLGLTLQGFNDFRRATFERKYGWKTLESGIWSVREGIRSNRPDIIKRYENLAQLEKDEIERLKIDIYGITSGHLDIWGLGRAMNQRKVPYFHGSHIQALMLVFPDLNLNPFGFQLDWSSEERGVESVRYVLSKKIPHIMERYERIAELNDRELNDLRNEIYRITQGHFNIWGLNGAMNQKVAPYFHGSYIVALIALFPDLNLNPLGFQLDWSSEDRGIESVKYVLSKEVPHIMREYEKLDQLNDREIHDLKNEIYGIRQGHFNVWGLGGSMNQKADPYFHGSYIHALLTVFSHSKLGLTREGFAERTGNAGSAATQMAETTGDEDSDSSVMTESPGNEESGSNLTREDSATGDLDSTLMRELGDNRYPGSPLMTEDTRSEAINRGMNPNGWITQLFFAPHYEFLDTFNPVRFFKNHSEQTVGQAIGIVLIWGAMVATMIGAPFGIDFLLSGNPTNHLGITLLSSFIGSLSIVAGIRLNHLKENEDQLNQLKKTSGSHSELKQQRSALNVVVQELIHFNKFIQTSYKPNRTEKLILSIAYLSYPINVLTHHLFNLISNFTRPLGKWRLTPLTKAGVGVDQYDWVTREQGIENVRDGIRKNRPDLLERYENLDHLDPRKRQLEEESLRKNIYRITSGHFKVWGLSAAMTQESAPYFHGSYITALITVFPELNLNPLGFRLDWSSEEKGIESVKYVLSKEVPHIMQQYERISQLNERDMHDLRNKIYGITYGHLKIWGLSAAMTQESAPYFHGSYITALITVFPDLNLNPLGFQLDWSDEKRAIESVRYILSKEVPHLMRQHERITQLKDREVHDLRNEIYGITQAHFKVWGLHRAMDSQKIPYFHGSYKDVLIYVFNHPRLELNLQGFKDFRKATFERKYGWGTRESGIWNVREAIRSNRPDIIERYENLGQLKKNEIKKLRRDIYGITSGHFKAWGLSAAISYSHAPYFLGSHVTALMAVFPDLNLNPLVFRLDWSSEERGIESVRYVLSKEVPHIMRQYKRITQLNDREIYDLRNEIYGITQAHFSVWGLGAAMTQESAPYFHGSYTNILMAVFPELNLNSLGFQLDWSSKERGIQSVKYILSREAPHIMRQYERITQLNDREVHDLRKEIYGITQAHFTVWGLGGTIDNRKAPYFHGSYMNALMAVFPHSKLGLTREGFVERTENSATDILEPLVQPQSRFKTWKAKAAYYLFVGSWEEVIYRWGGLVGLPLLLSLYGFDSVLISYFGLDFNSGQILGVVWSSAGFLFSHTIVRWLSKRKSVDWNGWKMELKKDFLSLKSFHTLLYNLLFISIISFHPSLVSFALLSVSSLHFTIDMLDAYKKRRLNPQELLSQEIELIADKLGTSQPELQSLSFEPNLNFATLIQTLFGVWSKDIKGSELYLVDLTGARDQASQIALLRTIHEIYRLNQNARFILVMDEPKPIEELESILGIKGILSTVSNPEQAISQTKALLKQGSYAVRLIADSDNIGIWSNLMDELGKTVRDIHILVLQILDVGVAIKIVLPKDKIFNAGIDQWIRNLEGRGRIERNGRELTIQGVELEPPSLKEDHQLHSLFSSQA